VFRVADDQRPARVERLAEEGLEHARLVAVGVGMLLPDERIGGDRIQVLEVVGPERPQRQTLAAQDGLEVEGHAGRASIISPRGHFLRQRRRCLGV
jgi:hypothetical protein